MINVVRVAKIENNIVTMTMDISYQDCLNKNNKFSEKVATEFCKTIQDGDWVISPLFPENEQRIAVEGSQYLESKKIFISPNPGSPLWFLDVDYLWKPPTKRTKIEILGD